MDFLIADTFTDSLTRLTNDEQKAVKTTAFDLQVNPSAAGLSVHRLDKARDKRFWSVRVSDDIRLIIHRDERSLLLCYVDHHDAAYAWAERRKLETHPKTGAAQLVEVRERIEEIVLPRFVEVEQPVPTDSAPAAPTFMQTPLFGDRSDEELLAYGVPVEWLEEVRQVTEANVLDLTDHLPSEAAEALLELAVGGVPPVPKPVAAGIDPFEHPDARRRFRAVANMEELERALAYPWEKWAVFLHPGQRELVERDYTGPTRISGSAGTGKTVVALHRAVYLAKTHPDARVLLTTFSEPLARLLRTKLRYLIGNRPRVGERVEVQALDTVAARLYERRSGKAHVASREVIRDLLTEAAMGLGTQRFNTSFLLSEWEDVVDAWQLESWAAYRDVARLGRKTRLPEPQRAALWTVFEVTRAALETRSLVTQAQVFGRLTTQVHAAKQRQPFDFVVVDEAQDVNVPQLRFLAALGGGHPNGLFFAGDLGQRIFQQPFSWKALGVDIRGRSRTLRVNYRTSHQIRTQADRLLGPQVADVDGNIEDRRGTVSVFNGPDPVIQVLDTPAAERACISTWLKARLADTVKPHEIGVFVRSTAELPRARAAVEQAGLKYTVLGEHIETQSGFVSVGTMHLAKGLEFRAVAVAACDDEVLPLQDRIEAVVDDADLEEVYNTERHLLYVACTRARDNLLVTAVAPASEFLDDLGGKDQSGPQQGRAVLARYRAPCA